MGNERFERLSDGQKECLRLFHARYEVKDIARRIGRSPVTVNQRLAAARRHLGVDRSSEAARLFVEHEAKLYSPSIYEPIIVAEPLAEPALSTRRDEGEATGFPLPFPTKRRPINDLSFALKLTYALVLAALIALMLGGTVAALNGLSELF